MGFAKYPAGHEDYIKFHATNLPPGKFIVQRCGQGSGGLDKFKTWVATYKNLPSDIEFVRGGDIGAYLVNSRGIKCQDDLTNSWLVISSTSGE